MWSNGRTSPASTAGAAIRGALWPTEYFKEFLRANIDNPKAEYYIPLMVNKLITEGTATVEVLDTTAKWFGVTYAADRQGVVDKIRALVDAGEYPAKLF